MDQEDIKKGLTVLMLGTQAPPDSATNQPPSIAQQMNQGAGQGLDFGTPSISQQMKQGIGQNLNFGTPSISQQINDSQKNLGNQVQFNQGNPISNIPQQLNNPAFNQNQQQNSLFDQQQQMDGLRQGISLIQKLGFGVPQRRDPYGYDR